MKMRSLKYLYKTKKNVQKYLIRDARPNKKSTPIIVVRCASEALILLMDSTRYFVLA